MMTLTQHSTTIASCLVKVKNHLDAAIVVAAVVAVVAVAVAAVVAVAVVDTAVHS